MLMWLRNVNLWCLLNGLGRTGPDANGERLWRFTILPLTLPTEQHIELAEQILRGRKDPAATRFSKHL
jgi:hypothetical protein